MVLACWNRICVIIEFKQFSKEKMSGHSLCCLFCLLVFQTNPLSNSQCCDFVGSFWKVLVSFVFKNEHKAVSYKSLTRPLTMCAVIYRNNKALESCGNARSSLQSTLQRIRPEGWRLWTQTTHAQTPQITDGPFRNLYRGAHVWSTSSRTGLSHTFSALSPLDSHHFLDWVVWTHWCACLTRLQHWQHSLYSVICFGLQKHAFLFLKSSNVGVLSGFLTPDWL